MKTAICICGQPKDKRAMTCRACRKQPVQCVGVVRTQDELIARIVAVSTDPLGKDTRVDEVNELMKQAEVLSFVRIIAELNIAGEEAFAKGFLALYCDVDRETWEVAEPNEAISKVAKGYLPFVERAIRRRNDKRVASIVAQIRAWKWLLGHPDADTLLSRRPLNAGHIYKTLCDQVKSGQWDYLTRQAFENMKGQVNGTTTNETSTALQAA